MSRIKQTLSVELEIVETHAWSDSTIVLNWLAVRHVTFKVFVSNKVQSLLTDFQWHHISSEDNPADCASRGLTPSGLVNHVLFWKGPTFLTSPTVEWATRVPSFEPDQLPEAKQVFECYLTRVELDSASLAIVRFSQLTFFSKLRHELSCSKPISVRSVARLRPYIDDSGVIRVGGRLSNAQLSNEQRHPVLLAKSSHLSLLLIRHWHDLTGHSGPRVITALLGRQYWIMSVGILIRTVISHCTRCVRLSAANPQPVMADLPRSRVTECRPFSRVGIDYAGPLLMKEHRLRKARQYKIYVAVFVCFAVKAEHLEVVSDLSTNAFIAALNRFVARRGLPTDIYSNCGTNFLGAAAQLKNLINRRDNQGQLSASIQSVWHFNPPGAPHFGGQWEAAVRSAKTLLIRIMGEHTITLEEFTTILCDVEAILNSRPLTPSSTDPNEIDYLSPGHFLIGQPLLAPPEENIPPTQYSLHNRWKLLNQCAQAFWRR
ncbi:uncharacterized protein LOC113557746 [Rhopalosiphum maidis]|uniref:uncharacterized protein LOC113557746 n=1 Tax=Rhopalosiphum maidis TaxID=43146 RepID=UPI000EFE56FB|nr:uncharacterized protein LOC113557746 [Rhopalosiphum maidis]